jgi:hypothetical protein
MDDANKFHHIFAKPGHNLSPLVRRYRSRAAAYQAMQDVLEAAFAGGSLVVDNRGGYRQAFNVGGVFVTVKGTIVAGRPRIGTAWIRRSGSK